MNHSPPILICETNEELRALLREMLIKHGHFHLLEVQSEQELAKALHSQEDQFLLIEKKLLGPELRQRLRQRDKFIVFAQPDDEETPILASLFGVRHIVSFPYSSKSLSDKIGELLR
jgi:DNA-binding response OmpR family regulator